MVKKQSLYFDYAAATPVKAEVLRAMLPYYSERFYNPSATYLSAKEVTQDIRNARDSVAKDLGARSSEIIFTAGGTEANNLAIRGVMQHFPDKHLVVSAIEHESILEPAKNYHYSLAPVQPDGRIDMKKLERAITADTVLVSVMLANNEVGTIEPIRDITEVVKNVRQKRAKNGNVLPLYVHTDACQAALYLDLHVHRLGVDMMTINGGKMYGPKQCGALYVKTGVQLAPIIRGGGQENGWRSGTENVAGIIGLATALVLAQKERVREGRRLAGLRDSFIKQLGLLPGVTINGSQKYRLPNNVHISVAGHDNERLMMELDEAGIQCAVGSACSASNEDPSHVLLAMGLSEDEARSSLRFSLGKDSTERGVAQAVRELKKLL